MNVVELWNTIKEWYVGSGLNEVVLVLLGGLSTFFVGTLKSKLIDTTTREVKAVSTNKVLREQQEQTETLYTETSNKQIEKLDNVEETMNKLVAMVFLILQNAKTDNDTKERALRIYEKSKVKVLEATEEIEKTTTETIEEIKEIIKEEITNKEENANQYSTLVDGLLNKAKENATK